MPETINATKYRFNGFTLALCSGLINLASDEFAFALTNVAPKSSDSQLSDLTEISAGNGYAAGGITGVKNGCYEEDGNTIFSLADPTISASGGNIGPFRYVVLYSDSAEFVPQHSLVCFYDLGQEVLIENGDSAALDLQGPTIKVNGDGAVL